MDWIKRNLILVIGGLVALGLIVVATLYTLGAMRNNATARENLESAYNEYRRLNTLNPHPGYGKVDNIKVAREQERELRAFLGQVTERFTPIAPIPANPTPQEYADALRRTIDQLQRDATNQSVVLPPRYNYSFEAQRQRVTFAEGSLPRLAVQLGEVKVIADILNAARINSLESIRRERVSVDDQAGSPGDYLTGTTVTNDLALLTPYEVNFLAFSPELAAVLSGFANSPHALVVKVVNVQPAGVAVVDPLLTGQPLMETRYVNPISPAPIQPQPRAMDEAAMSRQFRDRYGIGRERPGERPGAERPPSGLRSPGGYPQPGFPQPGVPTFSPGVAATGARGGLRPAMDEQQQIGRAHV
mgnify:CR=1 FL=1